MLWISFTIVKWRESIFYYCLFQVRGLLPETVECQAEGLMNTQSIRMMHMVTQGLDFGLVFAKNHFLQKMVDGKVLR